jgi:hypothetical protein
MVDEGSGFEIRRALEASILFFPHQDILRIGLDAVFEKLGECPFRHFNPLLAG